MKTSQKFAVSSLFSLLVAIALPAQATDLSRIAASAEDVQPVAVGSMVPGFTVRTVGDEPFVFDPAHLDKPVVLITFRGGWCPYCNMHLSELHTVIPEIRKKGIDVLFLSGDRPELLFSSLKRETQETIAGLDYTILSDADMDAATALGIAFRLPDSAVEGFESRGTDIGGSSIQMHHALPVPAVFVIDAGGVIRYEYVEPDYKIRLAADKVLAAAELVAD